MSELPEGWVRTLLSDVAQWGSGGTPSRNNPAYYGGNIPWIKTGELGQGIITDTEEKITELGLQNSSAKLFPKGSVAVAMYGATIGKTSILGIEAATNQACAVGIPIEGVITAEYLFHYLASQKDAFVEAGKGGAQPNISQSVIKNWAIPLAPLNEQKRIADKLDRLLPQVDACRERCDRIPFILKRFRQSVLAAATSGKLTEDWREERNLRFEDWRSLSLEDAVDEVKNGIGVKPDENPSGISILRISSVRPFSVNFDDYRRLSSEFAPETYLLQKDDLLFTRYNGTLEFVGVCARVKDLPSYPVVYPDKLIRVRVNKSQATPGFIEIATNSPSGRKTIEGLAKTSAGQTGISGRDLKGVSITLPSLEEQQEIVRRVEILFTFAERLEARYQSARAQVDRLAPALLDKAFRGEIVPQDPNDEPASVLLEQIRSELAKAKTNKLARQQRVLVDFKPSLDQITMLTREDVQPSHLSSILKTQGSLTAENLWAASQLEIDDFYDQLKQEEEQGLLREIKGEGPDMPRLLEAV